MLGIIAAMEEEISQLKARLTEVEKTERAGLEFWQGRLSGREVVLVRSGIGKVNAAACTQLLLERYPVAAVVNTGIAGSLNAQLRIGDVLISTDAVQHDVDASGWGYRPGEIPRSNRISFAADERLRALALRLNREVNPDIQTMEGRVVSGDQFISSRDKKEWLKATFAGDCCEMEGAAIAQVCTQNGCPFLIVRAISDQADEQALVDYPSFERDAIARGVRLMTAMIEAL